MLSALDEFMLHLTGSIAGRHALLDNFVVRFTDLNSVKLLPLTAILIYLWFRNDESGRSRHAVIEAVLGVFVAILVSRLIQNLSPLRLRPLHSHDPAFVPPIGTKVEIWEHWSSFPSDHAAVVFALSAAIWHVSRRLGLAGYVWSVCVVCLPRIYAGYHYASDILGGAVIGIGVVLCLRVLAPIGALTDRINGLAARYPGLFNATFFVAVYFLSTMFDDIRMVVRGLLKE